MKEYSVLCIYNGGTPYRLPAIYDNLIDCISYINRLIEHDLELRILAYVDNDFYNNKYSQLACKVYYQIQERIVTDYIKSAEEKNNLIYLKSIDL